MGERKGQNFYYPPDFDPKKHGNLNRYHGVHALRERAHKIHLGILVIRFEMPFNIWCLGCNNHVGMGVRYNAEKKKVGNYYSTPIYEFRMKCHLCDNYYEIRTDPQHFDYELVSGCRRQERRWEPSETENVAATERAAAQKLASDAMYKLEHGERDRQVARDAAPRLVRLERIQRRTEDDFAANQALRHRLRTRKKVDKTQAEVDDDLKKRSSLPASLKLLPEHADDKKLASLLSRYRTLNSFEHTREEKRKAIEYRSIFGEAKTSVKEESPAAGTSKISGPGKKPSKLPAVVSALSSKAKYLLYSARGKRRRVKSEALELESNASVSSPPKGLIRPKKRVKLEDPCETFPPNSNSKSAALVDYAGSESESSES